MSDSPPSLNQIALPIFRAWEKLRFLYLIIMALITILIVGMKLFEFQTLLLLLKGALVANVLYFAGPVFETYLCWLGLSSKWVRPILFVAGTLLTALLALGLLFGDLIPDQD